MKRHSGLFPRITDIGNLSLAFRRARKGKTWQHTVRRVENDLEDSLEGIRSSLIAKTFRTSPYKEKHIYEPKARAVYRLPFSPDRIVQHALMNILEPIWNALFIDDSYACRRGKGIHAGSRRTMDFVRAYRYCLKCDVSKFYPSVDHDVLFNIIQRKIKCRDTLWLIEDIIYSFSGGKNVPIGNYTSQWFGNLYLNELDQILKHRFKIKGYVRYCDDFCLFHNDKKFLLDMAQFIKGYLGDRLLLSLSKCDLFPVSRGVDFLGYRHFPGFILVRKSTVKRVKRRLCRLPDLLTTRRMSPDQYRSSVASTIGWLKWANAHNLMCSLGIDGMVHESQAF